MDQEAVKVTALQVLFDLLHTFGLDAFQVDQNADQSTMIEDTTKQPESVDGDNLDGSNVTDDYEEDRARQQQQEEEETAVPHTASSLLSILSSLLDSEVKTHRSTCMH